MPLSSPLLRPSRLALVLCFGLSAAALWFLSHLPQPETPLGQGTAVLQDVSVFDPRDLSILKHQDLSWTDGRISGLKATGAPIPAGVTAIPGKGLTALPGFCDAAVFLSLEGRLPQDSVPADPAQNLRRELSGGVTSLLDLNANRTFMDKTRALTAPESGDAGPWPRLRFAGALFAAPGGWRLGGQTPWDTHVAELSEMEDLQASWPLHLRFRDQAVFASVEHEGRSDLAIPLPVLKRLGELAHAQGVPFIIHAQHPAKALQALAAKPDAILGPLLTDEAVPDLALAMKHQQCAYLPALGVLLNGWPGRLLIPDWLLPIAQASQGTALMDRATDPPLVAAWQKHLSRQNLDRKAVLRALLDIYLAKVPLALGTGSGLPLVFHGPGRECEFELWQEAGVPVGEALRAATMNSYRLVGLEGGRLQTGARADVVLVQGDPLQTPHCLQNIQAVYVGGQAVAKP